MKKILSLALILLSGVLSLNAQTTNNNVATDALNKSFSFLESGSNFMVASYGITSSDFRKFGGGVAIAYKLSEYVAPVVRLDVYDHSLFMPSGSMQLQVPIAFGAKLKVIPFAFSGLATPLSGRHAGGSDLIGIFGTGAAIQISQKWDIIGDYERWTGGLGDQIRFGALYKF